MVYWHISFAGKERKSDMRIKVLLFDLGGVLVEFIGIKRMAELTENRITQDELSRRWIFSEFVRLYESGRCSTETFAAGIIKELGMDITPGEYIKEFPSFVKGFFPGAVELLQAIKPNYTLACLSNINAVHWHGLCERVSIEKYFHHNFLSFEMGKLKPDLETYAHVIEKLGCTPSEIGFFDDNEVNVQGGINAGMRAYKVSGFKDLREKLKTLNLW